MSKKCSKCNINKENTLFGNLKSSKDGLRHDCMECRKKYREENKESIKIQQSNYYMKNKEETLLKNKKYREEHKETINIQRKEYRNRENIKEHNKQKMKEYLPIRKAVIKEKRKSDLNFRLSEVLRSKFHKFIKGIKTSLSIYLGCSVEFLKKWLESNFYNNMSWDNYGLYWDIDHVIPVSAFDFSDENNIKLCYNWINLKPLEKMVNIKKSNKIDNVYIYKQINDVQKYLINNTDYEYQSLTEKHDWLREKTQVR